MNEAEIEIVKTGTRSFCEQVTQTWKLRKMSANYELFQKKVTRLVQMDSEFSASAMKHCVPYMHALTALTATCHPPVSMLTGLPQLTAAPVKPVDTHPVEYGVTKITRVENPPVTTFVKPPREETTQSATDSSSGGSEDESSDVSSVDDHPKRVKDVDSLPEGKERKLERMLLKHDLYVSRKRKESRAKEREEKERYRKNKKAKRLRRVSSEQRRCPPITREVALRLIPEKEVLSVVKVSVAERLRILTILREMLADQPTRSGRFRNSHQLEMIDEEIVLTNFAVLANKGSQPTCIVCSRKIGKEENRCKLDLFLSEETVDNVVNRPTLPKEERHDFCSTHAYHLSCFIVFLSTKLPEAKLACVGTCRDCGGCRQPGAKSKEKNASDKPEGTT